MIDHLAIQCAADTGASAVFCDAVLVPLGGGRTIDFDHVAGFGAEGKPAFWIGPRVTGDGVRECHVAFVAADRSAVRAFFDAAIGQKAPVLYQPRVWPEYHPDYHRACVRDPDGNNVEAVCHSSDR